MSNEPGSYKSTSRDKWTRTNNVECKAHWQPWGNLKVLHDDMPDRRRSYALMPSSHGHVNCICSQSVLRAIATNGARRLLSISSTTQSESWLYTKEMPITRKESSITRSHSVESEWSTATESVFIHAQNKTVTESRLSPSHDSVRDSVTVTTRRAAGCQSFSGVIGVFSTQSVTERNYTPTPSLRLSRCPAPDTAGPRLARRRLASAWNPKAAWPWLSQVHDCPTRTGPQSDSASSCRNRRNALPL